MSQTPSPGPSGPHWNQQAGPAAAGSHPSGTGSPHHARANQGHPQQGPPQAGGPGPSVVSHHQYGQMAPGQAGYWPQAEPVYSPSVHELILNQVLYYFSPENLTRDDFLRGHMCPSEGWLSIQLLGTFNRLRSLTTDINVIAEVRIVIPPILLPARGAVNHPTGGRQSCLD